MKRFSFLLSLFLFSTFRLFSQTNFYAADTIQKIEITFTQPNWDHMMDTAKYGMEGYVLAASVKVNGISFDSVGVKYKGYSSYDSTRAKNPLHIKLDYVHQGSNYLGVQDIKLGNGFSDPTSLREVLSYEILRNYMDAPQSNFAKVYINGVYYGVFSSSESIDKRFLSGIFQTADNTFFKCNPANVVSGQIPNLLYLGTDSVNYYSRYEIKSKIKWKDLIDLCDTLVNKPTHIDSILDVDKALWMLAFNNVTVNLDSYTGAFSQNYYLYRDQNARFAPIIWDLNMCFGGFANTGSGTLNIASMQNMSPVLHATNGARPLIMNLLANSTYNKMYIAHMRTLDDEYFASGSYLSRAQSLQALIDTSVQSETYSLYTYPQFQSSLTTNNGNIPGLSTLMNARSTYLNSTSQFQQQPPAISSITTAPSIPNLSDTIWVTCKVSNQTAVLLGYRDQRYNRFRRVSMFDDGLHHDGLAGDSIFGAGMIAASFQMQYYIYAENANAGMFSPERAEHEFYLADVNVPTPSPGPLLINEFLANNISDTVNEAGQHEDWIEITNSNSGPLDLYGLYLTDDFSNPKKYAFPFPTVIPAMGRIVLWADGGQNTAQYLHCNFNLSEQGEQLMLSDGAGVVHDSLTFGIQKPDTAFGRCFDGIGPMDFLLPSFNDYNICGDGVSELSQLQTINVFPNPVRNQFTFTTTRTIDRILIINQLGEIIRVINSSSKNVVDAFDLSPGLYCVLFLQHGRTFYLARFVKQ